MSVVWVDKQELLPLVVSKLEQTDVVLDIGCGIMPQCFVRPVVHICVEPFIQYVEVLQEKTKNDLNRTYVILHGTWADALKVFPPKSVDSVFLVDVIEHLEKEQALALLKATEVLARRQIAIFTPLGFMPQSHTDGKDAWGLDGAAWQEHKSGWLPTDFDESWDVYASEDFHARNNIGKLLDIPFGAMWIVKNINAASGPIEQRRKELRWILHKLADHSTKLDLHIYKLTINWLIKVKYSNLAVKIANFLYGKKQVK